MTLPEYLALVPRFRAYRRANKQWGSLYLVLDRREVQDECLEHCRAYAESVGDEEGLALAGLLAEMTMAQRRKLAKGIGKPGTRGRKSPGRLETAVLRTCEIR